MAARPHTQDRTSCLLRGPSQILLLPSENNHPRAAILTTRIEFHNTRCLLLRKDAALLLITIVLRADLLLPSHRNITESGHLRLRLRVRYCGRMTASVTGSENNSMRLNVLMSESGGGA